MESQYRTPLQGRLVLCRDIRSDKDLQRDPSLYKFIWVQRGRLSFEVDNVPMTLGENQIISLSPLHHLAFPRVNDEAAEPADCLSLLFNSNFYCIYGHDKEVSCGGFLFNGTSHIITLTLSPEESEQLQRITNTLAEEYDIRDNLQEEMLRILLKRFIITCTRFARGRFAVSEERENSFDIIRRFFILVDEHFREKKKVQDYADMLNRSPKTLSNIFTVFPDVPTPLAAIHERIEAEAKRLLLYTPKSAKEIADLLGFDDLPTFSRFFKRQTGQSISRFRHGEKAMQ
jgi:AraC-like DNA-binding protein